MLVVSQGQEPTLPGSSFDAVLSLRTVDPDSVAVARCGLGMPQLGHGCVPAALIRCPATQRLFFACEANLHADEQGRAAARSPWSDENALVPDGGDSAEWADFAKAWAAGPSGARRGRGGPSGGLRDLEVELNERFAEYTRCYFPAESAIQTSAFITGISRDGFVMDAWLRHGDPAGLVLGEGGEKAPGPMWLARHVVTIFVGSEESARYTVASSLMARTMTGRVSWSTVQAAKATKWLPTPTRNTHVVNLGSLVLAVENRWAEAFPALASARALRALSADLRPLRVEEPSQVGTEPEEVRRPRPMPFAPAGRGLGPGLFAEELQRLRQARPRTKSPETKRANGLVDDG